MVTAPMKAATALMKSGMTMKAAATDGVGGCGGGWPNS